jgi:hypothetical protein
VESLTVTLEALVQPDADGNTHACLLEATSAQTATWPLGTWRADVRFADAADPPVVIYTEAFTVQVEKWATPALGPDAPASIALQLSLAPVLRGEKGDDSATSASSRSAKDAAGIYTIVEYRRADNSLLRRSVLSGGTSPEYTTRTETVYGPDGSTVIETLVFTLTYASGELIAEDLA